MTVISPGPVPGSTLLPGGFRHPHASQEARAIAEQGMILRVQVGSGAYLRSIRRGERSLDEVLAAVTGAEERLTRLADSPAVADQPDCRWVDDWLHRSYQALWARRR